MVKGLGVVKTYKLAKDEPKAQPNGHCEREACPYRGLSSHIARMRVQELVRGGLGLEDAARFVREQCG
jgi:hypothetical protein